jgi:hypothetical protein
MKRRLAALGIMTVIASGMGVATASAATSSCTSHQVTRTSGSVSTMDSTRSCTLVRGGRSVVVTHKVTTKGAVTIVDTRTVTDSRTVSVKGIVTVSHKIRNCHKVGTALQTCTTDTNSY